MLRSLVHAVNDGTNREYSREVREFLEAVSKKHLPFTTEKEKALTKVMRSDPAAEMMEEEVAKKESNI